MPERLRPGSRFPRLRSLLQAGLYRATLLAALAAFVVLMFSVVSRPEPLRSGAAADVFDGERAFALTSRILELGADRTPGSRGDGAAADLVAQRFRSVEGGQVSEQTFTGSFDGDDVQLRNVTLVMPGSESDERIVITAPRDCAEGPCAASSAAATAALMELASSFDATRHRKTLVLVSTDGSAAGAAGARLLAGALEPEPAEAVVVITQPGSASPRRPFVVPWSAGPQSTSVQLLESAEAAVESEAGPDATDPRTLTSLVRLAIPSGLGEQSVLIEQGSDAIGISSAGDRPLAPEEDRLDSLSAATLGDFGRAALSLAMALDAADEPLEHGPDAYVPLAGKLLPGWALALLAATLLFPVGIVSVDGLARASRRNEPVLGTLAWVLGRSGPFLAALLLAYLMAALGLIAAPEFPFDPGRESPGIGALLALLALAAAIALTVVLIQGLGLPAGAEEAIAPAVGLLAFAAAVVVWIANPYLALLLVPGVHLWTAAALPEMRGRLALPLLATALGLVPLLLALGSLGASLGVGAEAPWQLLLMFTGRHFGPLAAIPLCVLAGCLASAVEIAIRRRERRPQQGAVSRPALGRRPGPGALGGPPSGT